tara:strand:+ start:44401 stop:44622 length:222 start_codon:yes stop_codon:yes gene_type:complete
MIENQSDNRIPLNSDGIQIGVTRVKKTTVSKSDAAPRISSPILSAANVCQIPIKKCPEDQGIFVSIWFLSVSD